MSEYISDMSHEESCHIEYGGKRFIKSDPVPPYTPNKDESLKLNIEENSKSILLAEWENMQLKLNDIWRKYVKKASSDQEL